MDGRRFWFWAECLVLPGVLGVCSTNQPPQAADNGYVLTVDLKPGDTQSEVLGKYGDEAVVWRPEAGFAILKLSADQPFPAKTAMPGFRCVSRRLMPSPRALGPVIL